MSVELMIIPGRDRYCQKVTRRQGNGLLQRALFDKKRGRKEEEEETEEDGERQRRRTITMKKKK